MTRACSQSQGRLSALNELEKAEQRVCGFKLLHIFVLYMQRACKLPKEIGGFVARGSCITLCSLCIVRISSWLVLYAAVCCVFQEEKCWRKYVDYLQSLSMRLFQFETQHVDCSILQNPPADGDRIFHSQYKNAQLKTLNFTAA